MLLYYWPVSALICHLLHGQYTVATGLMTAYAVATCCCISDEPCQWEKANFDPSQLRHLFSDPPETQIHVFWLGLCSWDNLSDL